MQCGLIKTLVNKTLLVLSLCIVQQSVLAVDNFYTSEFSIKRDSNFALATDEKHSKDDVLASLFYEYGGYQNIAVGHNLSYSASFEKVKYGKYDQWDYSEIGAQLNYRHKYGLGEYAPALTVNTSIKNHNAKTSVRDRWIYKLDLGIDKRYSNRWSIGSSLGYEVQNGKESEASRIGVSGPLPIPSSMEPMLDNDVFDFSNVEFKLFSDYAITENNYLDLAYIYRDGQVASLGRTDEAVTTYALAAADDPTFSSKNGVASGLFVYRIKAQSHLMSLAWNHILSDRASVRLSLDYQNTKAAGPLKYDRNILSLAYIYGN